MRQLPVLAVFAAALLAGCSGGGQDGDTATTNGASPAVESGPVPTPEPTPATIAYASLTGDAAKGESIFLQCKVCHTLEDGKNRLGPSLHAIIGRKAGEVPGFAYSPANKASGVTWTEEELFRFLEDPRAMMPGTKMAFAGISSAQTRADLIAYLKTASK